MKNRDNAVHHWFMSSLSLELNMMGQSVESAAPEEEVFVVNLDNTLSCCCPSFYLSSRTAKSL